MIDRFIKTAKKIKARIVLPEFYDGRIQEAAKKSRDFSVPVFPCWNDAEISLAKKSGAGFVDCREVHKDLARGYSKITGIKLRTAEVIVKDKLISAALLLKLGYVDAMVGGCVYTSGDFIAVSKQVIGLRKGIRVPSSFFIMDVPGFGQYVYADASVNPNPTAEELADIAVMTGISAKQLLGIKPRIAMLSFSTKGSAEHPDVCKVVRATELAKKKGKKFGLLVDGELQADAALRLDVAKRKIKGQIGEVAGRANVLIFPDLDAGNIAYKLTQYFGKARAYGPILQGFAKPLSDLPRGARVEDIIGILAIVSVLSQQK